MRAVLPLAGLILAGVTNLSAQAAASLSPQVREFVSVDAPVVALTHVQLIDGTGGPVAGDQTVIIANGRIQAVGRSGAVQVPAGATVLELPGHTVIPGIVGLHDHIVYETNNRIVDLNFTGPRLYLAGGVTTIRTNGALEPYSELGLKHEIEEGKSPGPRMHISGPHISGGGPFDIGLPGNRVLWFRFVKTPEEARRVVAYWTQEGADWFKLYTRITRAAAAAVVDEAHKRGAKAMGHLCSITFREAAALGMDNVDHGFLTNTDYDPLKQPDQCPGDYRQRLVAVDINSDEVRATFRDLVAKHVAMTGTPAAFEASIPNRPPLDQRVLDALDPEVRAEYLGVRNQRAMSRDTTPLLLFRKALQYEVAFVKAGGLLAAGEDPSNGNLPGFGDQRNYELYVEAGFTPAQAVQVMTANGAKVLGESDSLGTVTAGKLADLVVIDGDPVANPADIKKVVTVFKGGVGYDSAKLIASVRGLVGVR
ncbi:MAG: amidohydrolase family protein [Gemmatimonadetes bacterium]|nr:amidohydrolase family protein [Gemmatimonadota bacterium]